MAEALIDAGMDVARFNFSHGSHEQHAASLARLRAASDAKKKPVAALQDLCGPKIRTGSFDAPFDLANGAEVTLEEGSGAGDAERIPITYEGLAGDVPARILSRYAPPQSSRSLPTTMSGSPRPGGGPHRK